MIMVISLEGFHFARSRGMVGETGSVHGRIHASGHGRSPLKTSVYKGGKALGTSMNLKAKEPSNCLRNFMREKRNNNI